MNTRIGKYGFIGCLLVSFLSVGKTSSLAEEMHAGSNTALGATIQLLLNPNARKETVKSNPEAAKVDQQVRSAMGSDEGAEEAYQFATEVFEDLVKSSKGDPLKMITAIEKAKSNPEAFSKSLSPKLQAKLKKLTQKAEKAKAASTAKAAHKK